MNGHHTDVSEERRDGTSRATPRSSPQRLARTIVTVLACLVHAALGVTVSVSGLIVPTSAVRLLGLFWIAGVVVMFRGRRRPALLLAVPIASWAVWFAVVSIGEAWLGWTA